MNSKEIKEVILLLNTSQASKNIDNLKKKLEETRRQKEEANQKGDNKDFKKLGLEKQKLERQLQRLTTRWSRNGDARTLRPRTGNYRFLVGRMSTQDAARKRKGTEKPPRAAPRKGRMSIFAV